jgi:hypothetical protein
VRTSAVFNLREITLADATLHFSLHRADHFLLGHLAAQAAQRALHQPQVPDFLSQLHIPI